MDLYCGVGGLTAGLRIAGIHVHVDATHSVENDRDTGAAWQLNMTGSIPVLWPSEPAKFDLLDRIKDKEAETPQPSALSQGRLMCWRWVGPVDQGFTGLGHFCDKDGPTDRNCKSVSHSLRRCARRW